ncbi:TrkH family potassium uptake protein [Vogesella indigofera]|uniref:TrkH family potassium uptake protein n=1 Tax=Vogesella indigofera TaxID=45465 RepID=UPI00234F16CA|nr:potassium transporter TrkG [Vogesella indigofera]MDC7700420.1 potassium transporter TrkG [Vogesella indigofera]MDC7706690.1 potassium transporter TrkG [Vogesella indigofera]
MLKILPVIHVLAKLIMLFSGTFAFPALVSWYYDDGTLPYFARAAAVSGIAGLLLWIATARFERELKPKDGFILVTLLWVTFAVTACLPMLFYLPGMSVTNAFFESMSALTTTGATTMQGLDRLPPSINFWRHFLTWLGGMGIIVLAVAVLPLLGIGGMQLYKAETPGPMKDNKLAPRIGQTAKNLWYVYSALTLACYASLLLAGMAPLDALCHAFTAVALGGFSTKDSSISHFDSWQIEAVLCVFMILAAMNFATHFLSWQRRSLKSYWHDIEARYVVLLLLGSILAMSLYLWWQQIYTFTTALRYVSFNLISVATDTGYASTDYAQWPIFVPLWMLFLSCLTVSSGSTGGGIKMIRTLILTRQGYREMSTLLHPKAVLPLKIGNRVIPESVAFSVLGFIFVYFMSVVVFTFVLIGSGLDFITAFTASLACINNIGPGLGQIGPTGNYAGLSDFQTWVCTLAMLVGRLEVFSVLILFTPTFWRK